MLIDEPLEQSDAFVAAWWPGTQGGEAVVSALFGDYVFNHDGKVNRLPVPWPRNMASLKNYPIYTNGFPKIENPLFEEGHGLATGQKS